MIFDIIENAHLYKALSKNLAKGLDFIQNTNLLELQPGKYEIDGSNIFASVSNYETKNLVDGKFEAHKQYIDIQLLTSGEEKIYYAPLKETKEKEPYNEAKDITMTVRTMLSLSYRYKQIIIVNDGSSDNTGRLIEAAAKQHPWIKAVHRPDRGFRNNFGGEVQAFYDGYQLIKMDDWKYIAKLDCDLSFAPDYFERLINRFSCDLHLGIASGGYLEECRSGWREVKMPAHHAAGACKVVRRECFKQIGGPAYGTEQRNAIEQGDKTYNQ